MSALSSYAVVVFIAAVLCHGALKKIDCFETFTQGAKRGFEISVRILPTLCAMLIAVSVMRESGVLDLLLRALTPAAKLIGLPPEVLPLAIVRPFSGSAAMGVLLALLKTHGPDSAIGIAGCLIMGASETVFYTAGLYFGSVGVKRWRHTLPLCLLGSAMSLVMAALLT
jgi:spore maturation protein B